MRLVVLQQTALFHAKECPDDIEQKRDDTSGNKMNTVERNIDVVSKTLGRRCKEKTTTSQNKVILALTLFTFPFISLWIFFSMALISLALAKIALIRVFVTNLRGSHIERVKVISSLLQFVVTGLKIECLCQHQRQECPHQGILYGTLIKEGGWWQRRVKSKRSRPGTLCIWR
uniref:Uncharacterized protein n=1 Tax=Odontella aurita TaxID=265563 RepID=A0A7S4JPA6_9STRA|mmetsp:Transcript_50753/g.152843  ORF Transcript_50753/g.152843 Transcript_50753/m.152843 type:complete len:173 (+) Transcript_50753:378-896(+)